MTTCYRALPGDTKNLTEIFTKAKIYGRIRINTFLYKPRGETSKGKKNWAAAVGGSMIYKTARYGGFGMTVGLYTSQNPRHMPREEIPFLKGGKDTLSRYDAMTRGEFGMTVPAQAYLAYRISRTDFRIGRQIFESRTTASNDTKMIPNTFLGYSMKSEEFPKTTLKLGYFTRQKLRDHIRFHSVLSYGDDPADPYSRWRQNDDSAMHRGLTESKLRAAGIRPHLIVAEIKNSSLKNLHLLANYTVVPDLVGSFTAEACYRFPIEEGYILTPGIRYIRQFDKGAGRIGGANLHNDPVGYHDPDSVKGGLYALKLDLWHDDWKIRLGYSKTADKADLIFPWRAFPTAGFTRAMGQYNWYANTATKMLRFDYDLGASGLVPGTYLFIRYAMEDFDDSKPGTPTDCDVFECDLQKRFASLPNLYLKVRIAAVEGKSGIHAINGVPKSDPSHYDYRLELNYLF